ncbi:MAG: serine/threonine protein kinase [Acidimicrobiales bacterium]
MAGSGRREPAEPEEQITISRENSPRNGSGAGSDEGALEVMAVGPPEYPNRYELIEYRSRGGQADVWLGRSLLGPIQIPVAIKVFRVGRRRVQADVERAGREEAELLRCLEHPALPRVREFFAGTDPHAPDRPGTGRSLYLVMNWVDGVSLDEWARTSTVGETASLVSVMADVADALDYLHSGRGTQGAEVLHRDVSPDNVIISRSGPKLVDFSLARLGGGPMTFGGKPIYLAPEIVATGRYSPASDLFALGMTACFAFLGGSLPARLDVDTLARALTDRLGPGSDPLVSATLAALDPDPERRPQRAADWSRAMITAAAGEATSRLPVLILPPAKAGGYLTRRVRSSAASDDPGRTGRVRPGRRWAPGAGLAPEREALGALGRASQRSHVTDGARSGLKLPGNGLDTAVTEKAPPGAMSRGGRRPTAGAPGSKSTATAGAPGPKSTAATAPADPRSKGNPNSIHRLAADAPTRAGALPRQDPSIRPPASPGPAGPGPAGPGSSNPGSAGRKSAGAGSANAGSANAGSARPALVPSDLLVSWEPKPSTGFAGGAPGGTRAAQPAGAVEALAGESALSGGTLAGKNRRSESGPGGPTGPEFLPAERRSRSSGSAPVRQRRWWALWVFCVSSGVGFGLLADVLRKGETVAPPPPDPPVEVALDLPRRSGPLVKGRYQTAKFVPGAKVSLLDDGWERVSESADLLHLRRTRAPLGQVQIVRIQRYYRAEALATVEAARQAVGNISELPRLDDWINEHPALDTTTADSALVEIERSAALRVTSTGAYATEACPRGPCVLLFQLDPDPGRGIPERYAFAKSAGEESLFVVVPVPESDTPVLVDLTAPPGQLDSFNAQIGDLIVIERLGIGRE